MRLVVQAYVLTAILLLLTACAALGPSRLEFTPSQLEARLAKRLPLKKTYFGLIDLEVTNPRIALRSAEKRVLTTLDAKLASSLANRTLNGTIAISGVPRYDPAQRAIFADSPRVEKLDLAGVPPALNDQLKRVAELLAKEILAERPLATLSPEQLKLGFVEVAPKSIDVLDDRIRIDWAVK